MTMISDAIDSADAFHVKITTPSAESINSKVLNSWPQHWENVKNEAQHNTLVTTTFALSFLDLMSKLFN